MAVTSKTDWDTFRSITHRKLPNEKIQRLANSAAKRCCLRVRWNAGLGVARSFRVHHLARNSFSGKVLGALVLSFLGQHKFHEYLAFH